MPVLIDLVIAEPRWTERCDLAALAERGARAALGALDHDPDGFEIGLLGCDDARIAMLNASFRAKPVPTNVLSWPAQQLDRPAPGAPPPPPSCLPPPAATALGDIAIAWETCAAEARDQGKTMEDHVTHLIVHATLHLLGYDHVDARDAAVMEGLEQQILAGMGVADPY